MLTDQELDKIFSWQPYRVDWPVDRNRNPDNITSLYGDLIKSLTQNKSFATFYSEDGGLGNYLEFICYPRIHKSFVGNAIIVCVSLCSPIAAFGQTRYSKAKGFFGFDGLFSPDKIGIISDNTLSEIEAEIISILLKQKLTLLNKEFVSKPLPRKVVEKLLHENHNEGTQYLHGIFQKID